MVYLERFFIEHAMGNDVKLKDSADSPSFKKDEVIIDKKINISKQLDE